MSLFNPDFGYISGASEVKSQQPMQANAVTPEQNPQLLAEIARLNAQLGQALRGQENKKEDGKVNIPEDNKKVEASAFSALA